MSINAWDATNDIEVHILQLRHVMRLTASSIHELLLYILCGTHFNRHLFWKSGTIGYCIAMWMNKTLENVRHIFPLLFSTRTTVQISIPFNDLFYSAYYNNISGKLKIFHFWFSSFHHYSIPGIPQYEPNTYIAFNKALTIKMK